MNNSNWRNRPTGRDSILRNETDWIVAIDESGSHDLKSIKNAVSSGKEIEMNNSDKHFTVTACAINMKDFVYSRNMVMELKNKYWNNALYKYEDKLKRVCLHSREIRNKTKAFSASLIDYDAFINDLSGTIEKIPFVLYASDINKTDHIKKYRTPKDPYDLCLNFILERIIMDTGNNERITIMLESRGKNEDKQLLQKIVRLIDKGNNFYDAIFFQKIIGVYFNPKWALAFDERASYWETELADLCAYPIHKYLSYGTKDRSFEIIEKKMSHYPGIDGYGLKIFL